MKRNLSLVLCLALVLSLFFAFSASAATVKPGDTVTGSVSFSRSTPITALEVNYALSSGLTFKSVSSSGIDGKGDADNFAGISMSGSTSGSVTVTATVNADATGDQTIKFTSVLGAGSGEAAKSSVGSAKTVTFTVEAPAVAEVWGPWVVVTPATCLVKGQEKSVSDLGNEKFQDIAPLGHDWGAWTSVKAATCLEKGSEERVCKRDATHKETREVAALGHDWGSWAVKTPATCTAKGQEERVCKRDATHKETREIPMLAHKEGPWEIVRVATEDQPGLRVRKCQVGGEILKQEEIRFNTTVYYPDNTASTQGFRFRDVKPELTDKWFMFTPVDLSQDGEQVIPVIASNKYYIGNVKLSVAGGAVTATYEFLKGVTVKSEFLAYFTDLGSVSVVEPTELAEKGVAFGKALSIKEGLGGDTKVLLYAHFFVDYNDSIKGIKRFFNNGEEYQTTLKTLHGIMD